MLKFNLCCGRIDYWPEASITKQHSLQESSHSREKVDCTRPVWRFAPHLWGRMITRSLGIQLTGLYLCVRVKGIPGTVPGCSWNTSGVNGQPSQPPQAPSNRSQKCPYDGNQMVQTTGFNYFCRKATILLFCKALLNNPRMLTIMVHVKQDHDRKMDTSNINIKWTQKKGVARGYRRS